MADVIPSRHARMSSRAVRRGMTSNLGCRGFLTAFGMTANRDAEDSSCVRNDVRTSLARDLAQHQLRRADRFAVHMEEECVAPRRRELQHVELEWEIDGQRVDARGSVRQVDLAAG